MNSLCLQGLLVTNPGSENSSGDFPEVGPAREQRLTTTIILDSIKIGRIFIREPLVKFED